MKKKLLSILICGLLIVATGITVARTLEQPSEITSESSYGEKGSYGWGWYNPTGSWMRYDKELFITVSSAGWGRYALTSEGATLNPTWYGYFPTAVALSSMFGEMVATGKNTYDFSVIDYAVNASYGILYFRVWSGTVVQTSKDTFDGTFTASIFSPDQDPFGEEEPNYGCYGPYEFPYYRIPVVQPCGT